MDYQLGKKPPQAPGGSLEDIFTSPLFLMGANVLGADNVGSGLAQGVQQAGRFSAQKQNRADRMADREYSREMDQKRLGLSQQRFAFDKQRATQGDELRSMQIDDLRMKRAAGPAQLVRGNADNWNRFLQADPKLAASIPDQFRGDPILGADWVIAKARGYQEPSAGQQPKVMNVDGRLVRVTPDGAAQEIYAAPQATAAGQFKDAKQSADVEGSLRKEFTAMNKTFRDVQASYGRVQTSAQADNGAGDVALIFNYMKMLDPGSVVREGEFATAEQTSGVPTQVLNYYNKLISGERLAPSQRQQFVALADQLYQREADTYGKLRQQFEPIVKSKGLDPSAVMLDFTQPQAQPQPGQEDQQTQAAAQPQPQRIVRAQNPSTGQVIVSTDGGVTWQNQ